MADYEEYEEVPDQNDGNEVEGDNADAGEENLADLIFNAEITDKPEEEEDTEQKATIDEGASVLLHPEEIPRDSTREFAKNLYKSFQPCQRFMTVLCRFPIISYANDDHSIVFEYNWSSVRGNLFFITFAILLTLTGLCTLNIISTMLNFPKQPENLTVSWRIPEMDSRGTVNWGNGLQRFFPNDYTVVTITKEQTELRAEEMFLFRRNIASLLIVIFLMYHIVTADWNL
ncbi:unnamed protein product [Orchesella dallaii]|uniref:Uncharacterized protein n=1 Tax=Orchesella dallaii TaxID=48710 RepID=A0ABP1QY27_9HEXA